MQTGVGFWRVENPNKCFCFDDIWFGRASKPGTFSIFFWPTIGFRLCFVSPSHATAERREILIKLNFWYCKTNKINYLVWSFLIKIVFDGDICCRNSRRTTSIRPPCAYRRFDVLAVNSWFSLRVMIIITMIIIIVIDFCQQCHYIIIFLISIKLDMHKIEFPSLRLIRCTRRQPRLVLECFVAKIRNNWQKFQISFEFRHDDFIQWVSEVPICCTLKRNPCFR